MVVTTQLTDSTGRTINNAYFYVDYDTSTLRVDGIIRCRPHFYVSEESKDSGKEELYVFVSDVCINKFIFSVTEEEIVKAGANCTIADVITFFNTKSKEALNEAYGWNITI